GGMACAGGDSVDRSSAASGDAAGPGSGGAGASPAGNGGAGASSGGSGGVGGGCVPVPEELCDGVDNTCDDVIDEGCTCVAGTKESCFGGDEALVGIGICKAGERICTSEGVWADCEGEVLPKTDLCNGEDDDCDGATDEDLGSTTCGKGICEVTTENCIAGESQECEPGAPNPRGETCEGSDDDCDGLVDENCTCTNGNTQVCYGGSPATKNVGTCADGQQTCVGGQWGECLGDVTPVAETCDGLDNDCDGNDDDGDPEGGASCATGNSGVCGPGVEHCSGGQIQCQQTNQSSQETCNNLDDDCDGATDENNPGGGGACSTGKQGICAPGTLTCQNGAVACLQNAQPGAEICDGLDNDCDGAVDENNPGGGGACNTGLQGPCGPGSLICLSGPVLRAEHAARGGDVQRRR
ncbi:MAG: MopE-related protein, partial [Polyangiaceae bacterium]